MSNKAQLTMGPGLADPLGLHWLFTGEFLFAVERADYKFITIKLVHADIFRVHPPHPPPLTCHNVSDGFDEQGEGGDVGLAVLPHGLPYY